MTNIQNLKVENFSGKNGKVKNQFIITGYHEENEKLFTVKIFQSYDSVIVKQTAETGIENPDHTFSIIRKTYLDRTYWDYSITTGKYRNQFLGETKAETQKKIDSGEYILTDLN